MKKMEIQEFEIWLNNMYVRRNGKKLSKASIYKYSKVISKISDEMVDKRIIKKSFDELDLDELQVALDGVLNNSFFAKKDTIGHNMYSTALKKYRCYRFFYRIQNEEEYYETLSTGDRKTERVRSSKIRVGQDKFRKELLKKYCNKCIISGLEMPAILVASHIKPWKVSNNVERLDPSNGLLLSATYDLLFDGGLITFDENERLIVSSLIGIEDRKKLGLKERQKYEIKIDERMKGYLEYHQKCIFINK